MTTSMQTPYEILESSILSKPRMMGTPAEKETTAFLLDFLSCHGLSSRTEKIEWSNAKVNGRKAMYLILGFFIVLLNLSLNLRAPVNAYVSIPLAILSIVCLVLFGKALGDGKFKFFGKSSAGKNVLCDIEPVEKVEEPTILYFTAHSDSVASNMPSVYIKFMIGMMISYLVVFSLTIASSIHSLIDFYTASSSRMATIGVLNTIIFWFSVAVLLLIIANMFTQRVDESPGACDNGSGSAILLSLASHYKENPAKNLQLKFCWFAAEEWGLYGSKNYVADHKDEIVAQKDKSYLINVDMVGTELAYLDKAGMFIKKPINKKLNKLIAATAEEAGIEARSFKSPMGNNSDHAPFRKLKMEVAFFLAKKDTKRIHSPKDTLEFVKPEKLDNAVRLITGVVEKLDAA
jgi:Peptidase family M28